jgi:RNA polymerase sigma factor (sigma-70 family)
VDSLPDLISACRNGDLDAFGEIVRRFQNMAYGCAYAILSDSHLAEDVAQEAFIEAFHKLGELRDPAAFPGWFRRIVLTRCNRHSRRHRVETVPLGEAAELAGNVGMPDQEWSRKEAREQVLAAVRSLPEPQRLAVTLFYLGEHSSADVAGFLGISVGAVRKRLYDARRNLRERTTDMVGEALRENSPAPEAKAEQIRFLLALANWLGDGVPVLVAMEELAAGIQNDALREAVAAIVAAGRGGHSLASAMAGHRGLFPPMVISLVADGERYGILEATSRLAGEWLQTGTYRADPGLYCGWRSPIGDVLQEAVAKGAAAVTLRLGRGDSPCHPEFMLADGTVAHGVPLLAKQLPGIEDDLKQHTLLDAEQTGDELNGTLRVPGAHGDGVPPCRIRFRPEPGQLVVAIAMVQRVASDTVRV